MEIDSLIKKCIAKDKAAQKEFYYTFAKRVYGICRRYTIDDHEAEDWMQESMHKVFFHLHKYNSQRASIKTWISTITVNTILSHKAKVKTKVSYQDMSIVHKSMPTSDHRKELEDFIYHGITKNDLLSAIRKLSGDYRDVINLYVFENWTHADIAAILNIKESSSRSKLTRAKKILKELLTQKSIQYNERVV